MTPVDCDVTLSTDDVCRLAGVTFRQIDYWARTGVITPTIAQAKGQGSARRWSAEDVALVRIVADLSGMGAEGPVLTRVVEGLRATPDLADCRWIMVEVDDDNSVFVVASPAHVWPTARRAYLLALGGDHD